MRANFSDQFKYVWNFPTLSLARFFFFHIEFWTMCKLSILLIRDMVVESWNWQYHCQTIHPTEKFTSMNLYKIIGVVTWAWLFLTSMEAKHHTATAHFGTITQCLVHPTVPVLPTKRNKKYLNVHQLTNMISFSFQPPYLKF